MINDNNHGMYNNMRWRFAVFWLCVWLLLSVARQCFDLVGHLWTLLVFDLIQILALCSTLFLLIQHKYRRISLRSLMLLTLFSFLSLTYNIALLILWTTQLLTSKEKQKEELLAFGLPFGHSFFLRHTPFCPAHFNLTTHRWEQAEICPIPYSYFEGVQAIVHSIFAVGLFFFALSLFFFAFEHKQNAEGIKQKHQQQQPIGPFTGSNVSPIVEPYGQIMHSLQSSQDNSSYIVNNSLYDDKLQQHFPTEDAIKITGIVGNPRQQLLPVQPIRRSFPIRKEQQQQWDTKNGSNSRHQRMQQQQFLNAEHYSTLSTAEFVPNDHEQLTDSTARSPKSSSRPSSDSSTRNGKQRMVEGQEAHCNFRLHSRPESNQMDPTVGSSSDQMPLKTFAENKYITVPAMCRDAGEICSTKVTSLVSFDPKSTSGQLIRVLQHQSDDESAREESEQQPNFSMVGKGQKMFANKFCASMDSMPSTDAPDNIEIEGTTHPTSNGISTSIYDSYVLRSAPQDACTSFPSQPGAYPRPTLVQLAATSAIRLSRQDLDQSTAHIDVDFDDSPVSQSDHLQQQQSQLGQFNNRRRRSDDSKPIEERHKLATFLAGTERGMLV